MLKINVSEGFPGGLVVKNPPANAGDMGLIPVQEDATCCGVTKSLRHKYWACALEPGSHKRSHDNEKPTHHNYRKAPSHCN